MRALLKVDAVLLMAVSSAHFWLGSLDLWGYGAMAAVVAASNVVIGVRCR